MRHTTSVYYLQSTLVSALRELQFELVEGHVPAGSTGRPLRDSDMGQDHPGLTVRFVKLNSNFGEVAMGWNTGLVGDLLGVGEKSVWLDGRVFAPEPHAHRTVGRLHCHADQSLPANAQVELGDGDRRPAGTVPSCEQFGVGPHRPDERCWAVERPLDHEVIRGGGRVVCHGVPLGGWPGVIGGVVASGRIALPGWAGSGQHMRRPHGCVSRGGFGVGTRHCGLVG
jgi:hypothetical protein